MSQFKYDLVILPGRFQPFHDGHRENTKKAKLLGAHVLFLIGSANQPRTPKNPFLACERATMITAATRDLPGRSTVDCLPVEDFLYSNSRWIREVQHQVKEFCKQHSDIDPKRIAIMGHEKDESSFYLRSFPKWTFEATNGYAKAGDKVIDATKIRELMFEGHLGFVMSVVPKEIFTFLKDFVENTIAFQALVSEHKYYKEEIEKWKGSPYPVTFNTVDAVVVQGGHVALIQRKFAPGKDLWAIPGGFLQGADIHSDGFLQEKAETHREGCLRELTEETRIKVPEKILDANITYQHCFDHPDRSLRGRVITQAFLIELPGDATGLPKVRGADDAKDARWFSFDEVEEMSDVLFEDHFSILKHMLARTR